MGLIQPKYKGWKPDVVLASALEGTGIAEIWEAVEAFRDALSGTGEREKLRLGQAQAWLWAELREGLIQALKGSESLAQALKSAEEGVAAGEELPPAAARRLIDEFLGGKRT